MADGNRTRRFRRTLVASDEQKLSHQEQNFGPVVVANYRDDGEPSIPGFSLGATRRVAEAGLGPVPRSAGYAVLGPAS